MAGCSPRCEIGRMIDYASMTYDYRSNATDTAPKGISVVVSTLMEDRKVLERFVQNFVAARTDSLVRDLDVELVLIIQAGSAGSVRLAEEYSESLKNLRNVRCCVMNETGVARGRNAGMRTARNDIVLFADTDCRFCDSTFEIIHQAYCDIPEAGCITFRAINVQSEIFVKPYWKTRRRHSKLSIMRVATWEISVNRRVLRVHQPKFDERFGLGGRWPSSSEAVFVWDIFSSGVPVWYCPRTICATRPSKDRVMDSLVVRSKGAMIGRTWGVIGVLMVIPFICRRQWCGTLVGSVWESLSQCYAGYIQFYRNRE